MKDADLNRYLLGDSTPEEQSALERQFFADDELFGRLLEAETDLVDAYARGELNAAERAALERRLSESPLLRERVELARALGRLGPASHRPSSRFLALAVAAAVVLAVGGGWFALHSLSLERERGNLLAERQGLRDQISRLERAASEQEARLGEVTRELGQERKGTPSATARIVSFVLASGLTRDGSVSNRLVIPKDAEALLLELHLEAGGYRSYRVTAETAGGRAVAVLRGLPPDTTHRNSLRISLSPALFPAGDYILTLAGERGAAAEPVAEYAFRVVR